MRHLLILLCFCLYFSQIANCQSKNIILTEDQNNHWFDSLSSLSLENKLTAISNRLLSDTAVFVKSFYNDRIKVNEQAGDRLHGYYKPVIIIRNRLPIVIKNETSTAKILNLSELLTTKYIAHISLLKGNEPSTPAIYGQAGQGGVIFITLVKKKFLRKFSLLKI